LNRSRIAIAVTGIVALMVAAGAATYLMARRPVSSASATDRAQAQDGHPTLVPVSVTASACDPMDMTVPAGPVTFSIRNAGARALEWEILNGVMVVDERENIAPGFTQKLTTRLAPGEYEITCGLLTNPKGKLHVAATTASAKLRDIDLIGPLAEYRVYTSYEIDALAEDGKKFTDAAKVGDRDSARALFATAHAHYARLAPLVDLFPDLDRALDAEASEYAGKEHDPAFSGFHRLEWSLFANSQAEDLTPLADKLTADIGALQGQFENLAMSPEPTIAGAAKAIAKMGPQSIAGERDRYAGADLSDLSAGVESVKKLVDLFHPLIERADVSLSRALAEDFATLDATLGRYKTADGAFQPSADLSSEDRMALQGATKKLAADLALVRGALGLS
jgi:iron uptake system component EfeO